MENAVRRHFDQILLAEDEYCPHNHDYLIWQILVDTSASGVAGKKLFDYAGIRHCSWTSLHDGSCSTTHFCMVFLPFV